MEYSTALKLTEKRPTVKWLPRLVSQRPRMSRPPLEQPLVSVSPRPKPPMMPPTRQQAMRSSRIGVAGAVRIE